MAGTSTAVNTATQVSSGQITMTGGQIDTVTFDADLISVSVIGDVSPVAIWYTLDGSTPTVGGQNCYYLPAGGIDDQREPRTPGGTTVKLISSGAGIYVVQRGD